MANTTEIGNATEFFTSDMELKAKKTFLCFMIPFCDVTGCDRMKHYNPLDCPKCNSTMVGVFFIVLVLLALFIILGNTGIILVILRKKIFHNTFNMFKCSLAVADLLVGILVVPSGAYMLLYQLSLPFDKSLAQRNETYTDMEGQKFKRGSFCDRVHQEDDTPAGKFFSMISVLSIMASIFHLVLLSIDRFLAVRCPIKYNQGRALNNKTAAFLIIAVWAACTILSVAVPIGLGTNHFSYGLSPPMIFTLKTTNPDTGMIYAAFALGLPYLVLFALNFATGIMILKKRGKITRRTSNSNNSNNSRHSNEVKATITLLVMVLVFTLTTVPAMIGVTFYNGTAMEDVNKGMYVHGVIYCILIPLLVSNSAWNFIIYSWRNQNFRKALKELLHCKRNGRRRHFRWKKVKRSLRRSEKKRRRKKLAKLAESYNSNENSQSSKYVGRKNDSFQTISVRSIDSTIRSNHCSLHYKASVTSSISNSSSNNCTSTPCLPMPQNNVDYCHSPTIPEEDDIFFNETKTENGTIQDSEKMNGTIFQEVKNGVTPIAANNNEIIHQNGVSGKKSQSNNQGSQGGKSTVVENGAINEAYDNQPESLQDAA